MNQVKRYPMLISVLFLIAVMFCELSCLPSLGQALGQASVQEDLTRTKLKMQVHIKSGEITVAKLMVSLSDQTGVDIKAMPYLNERILNLQLQGVTAEALLSSLSELSDWTWYTTSPGHILVTRLKLRLDSVPAAVPRYLQASIPKDIRTYLSIRTPTEDFSNYLNMLDPKYQPARRSIFDKLMRTVISDQTSLITSLEPQMQTEKPISFDILSLKQRSDLLVALIFPVLRDMNSSLLCGDVLPHVFDVNNAVLQMAGNTTLLVGSTYNDGKTESGSGFGTEIR